MYQVLMGNLKINTSIRTKKIFTPIFSPKIMVFRSFNDFQWLLKTHLITPIPCK